MTWDSTDDTTDDATEGAIDGAINDAIEVGVDLLAAHDRVAAELRARFGAAGTFVVNLVSGPGSGKTELLTAVLRAMVDRGIQAGALVGDCATDNDAARLASSGAPVRQIVTEGLCHLEAAMIEAHLDDWHLDHADHPAEALDFLFIENVGNLVCPAAFDLGETVRAVLLSVTEGEDKPLKYPQIFHSADLAILTKIDLAGPCQFDRAAAVDNIELVHPGLTVIDTSARWPDSVDSLVDDLVGMRLDRHPGSTPTGTTVVIGCGNAFRGDDAVGPRLIEHLRAEDGLADEVVLVDGGTAGIDVAFAMRGADRVVLVDGARTGAEPGTIHRLPGEAIERLPEPDALSSHSLRWDHSLGFARWLLGDDYPDRVAVFLVEIEQVEAGTDLSEPVAAAMVELADLVRAEIGAVVR